MPQDRSDEPILGPLEEAVGKLPPKHRRRLSPLLDRLRHWLHLRGTLLEAAESDVGDLRIENASLRWDLSRSPSTDVDAA
jgi:hypothetical protein